MSERKTLGQVAYETACDLVADDWPAYADQPPDVHARSEAIAAAVANHIAQRQRREVRTQEGKLCCVEQRQGIGESSDVCVWKIGDFDATVEVDGLEPGESITLTYRELTDEEFQALGNFEGW